MQEESPEGGRFKKEVQIDNQSYLLLIRDEGGSPELQVKLCVLIYKIKFFGLNNDTFFHRKIFFLIMSIVYYILNHITLNDKKNLLSVFRMG